MIHLKKSEWYILVGLLLLSLIPSVGAILRLVELGSGDLEFIPENPRIQSAPTPVIFHLFSVVPYCILGALQFLPSFRKKYLNWHRLVGWLLVGAGIVSALSGLWMTHYYSFPNNLQGDLLYVVRILVGIAMLTFIVLGLSSILKMRMIQHEAWMIRAYALGQGAGTQILITIPWLLTVGEPMGLTRDILMSLAWLVNIFIGEWTIKNMRKY
ncbi:DUF2306 domain-containing protein [uncultured Maribacter sp.]|uniref:DUF2306 domain-containing protein n=1 Tax=uncultured Maribacter sp. TaxID=431308 RepID=UPI00261112A6|nr:DUF2306 domain-containing protein [uncultured Maribacter sp.]